MDTPEVFDILMSYSILNKFGSSYTWQSLDNVDFLDIQYMQLCMSAENKAQEMANMKADFVSKEGLSRNG